MIINVKDLPSKGINTQVNTIEINPFTYKDIINYNNIDAETFIQKIQRDMKFLREDIGENFDQLLFYDLDALIFIKKSISVTENVNNIQFKYKCIYCNTSNIFTVGLDKLDFLDLDDYITKIQALKLTDKEIKYSFQLPTMEKVKSVLDTISVYKENIDRRIFTLMCCFDFNNRPNEVKTIVENAKLSDIILLDNIYQLIKGTSKKINCKCNTCRKESSVNVDTLMTDFFQLLKINIKSENSKIILS